MKSKNRGSQQGKINSRRSHDVVKSRRQRQIVRASNTAAAQSGSQSSSLRRQTADSNGKLNGKLNKESAITALRDMGFTVDSQGNIDADTARKVAEGAAVSAAQALGVEIRKADGSIDPAKAQQAVETALGFSIAADSTDQQAAAVRAKTAATEAAGSILTTAKALNIDTGDLDDILQNADGSLNPAAAARIAEIALNLQVAKQRTLGRREATDALNISLDAATTDNPLTRRAASEAVEKLLSSSVLVDGKIDRRKALEALNTTVASG